MAEELQYDAFISYRHCSPDKEIAEKLHKSLENYRLPKALARKVGKRKLERVFRDEAELAVTDELSRAIDQALLHSEYLIVVCSPRLPESEWCMREIETFLKISDRKHILLVLIDGEPNVSFPEILRYEDVLAKDSAGNIVTVRQEREPLASDCRGKNFMERSNALHNTVLRLVATMFHLNYDDLKQRQTREKTRKYIELAVLVMIIMIFIIAQTVIFSKKVNEQNNEIKRRLAITTADDSMELLQQGRRKDAIYAARSVLPDTKSEGYTVEAFLALINALGIYEDPAGFSLLDSIDYGTKISNVFCSLDGSIVVLIVKDQMIIYDVSERRILCEIPNDNIYIDDIVFYGRNAFYYMKSDCIYYVEYTAGDDYSEELLPLDDRIISIADTSDVSVFVGEQFVFGYRGKECVYKIKLSDVYSDYSEYWDTGYSVDKDIAGQNVFFTMYKTKEDPSIPDSLETSEELRKYYDSVQRTFALAINTTTGEILFKKSFAGIVILSGVVNGNKALIIYNTYHEGTASDSVLDLYDTETNELKKQLVYPGDDFRKILCKDGYTMIGGVNKIVVLDSAFNIVASDGGNGYILYGMYIPNGMAIFSDNGYCYSFYTNSTVGDYIRKEKINYQGYTQTVNILSDYSGYYLVDYSEGILSIYGKKDSPFLLETEAPVYEDTDYSEDDWEKQMEEEAKRKQQAYKDLNIDESQVESSSLCEGADYMKVEFSSGKTTIYDLNSGQAVRSSYKDYEGSLSFIYLPEDDCFVMTTYDEDSKILILDSKFEIIIEIKDLIPCFTNKETGHLLVCHLGNETVYQVLIASYDEVIHMADVELGRYTPNEKIREKYNLD